MTLNNLEEVERWVLGFGEHATVIEPKELRQRGERIGRELARRCSTTDRRWLLLD
jgi:hypothetical protein